MQGLITQSSPWIRNDVDISFIGGNVGIGTTSPNEKFQVGSGTPTKVFGGNTILIKDASGRSTVYVEGTSQAEFFLSRSDSSVDLKFLQIATTSDGISKFRSVKDSGSIHVDNLIVLQHSTGHIGIGAASPDRQLHSEVSDAVIDAVTYGLRLSHISSGTVAAGFGVGIELELEGADGTNLVAAAIEAIWTDPDTGAEDADLIFSVALAGAVAVEAARLKSNADFNLITGGAFQINDTDVLDATTLGSAVVNSSLTNLGILTALTVGSGTKHDGYIITNAAEVQTTDATVTTLDSLTLLDENTYHIEAFVTGVKSDGTDRASYHLAVTVYRTAAGGATIQGSVTSLHTQESDAAWDADFTVSGNVLRVSVTGKAATTIEWASTITYMNSSN